MSGSSVRFAIIGCGRIAGRHVDALDRIAGANLVALCDLQEERARRYAQPRGLPVYTNYHRMLREQRPDVVCIITPSGMHAEHALDVMRRYRTHVVVEKPLALRVEDGEEMIATARELGLQLHVVMQNRFNAAVVKLREAVTAGRFGRLVLGTVRLRWCRPQRYYDQDAWRGTWAFDGGALTNQTVHHLDLLLWLAGEVEEVSSVQATCLVDVPVEDTAVAWLRFRGGHLGVIEATTGARPDDFEASVSLLGEHGTAIAEGASVNRLTLWTFDELDKAAHSEQPPDVYGFGHLPFLSGVTAAVRDGSPPLVGGEDGLQALCLLHALYASGEQQRTVRLADKPRSQRLGVIRPEDRAIWQSYHSEPEDV